LGASPIASLLCRGAGAAVACREAAAAATSGAPRPVKSVSPRPAPVAQWIEQRFPKPCAKVRFLPGVPAGAAEAVLRVEGPKQERDRQLGQPRRLVSSERSACRQPALVGGGS
jgi:hypothetical protein